jgi:hypothetical protein
MAIIQEFNTEQDQHRLKDTETGEVTRWAPYTCFTYLNGMVGYTAYYGIKEVVVTADEFCKDNGIGK